jgi:hypothetical protein
VYEVGDKVVIKVGNKFLNSEKLRKRNAFTMFHGVTGRITNVKETPPFGYKCCMVFDYEIYNTSTRRRSSGIYFHTTGNRNHKFIKVTGKTITPIYRMKKHFIHRFW